MKTSLCKMAGSYVVSLEDDINKHCLGVNFDQIRYFIPLGSKPKEHWFCHMISTSPISSVISCKPIN